MLCGADVVELAGRLCAVDVMTVDDFLFPLSSEILLPNVLPTDLLYLIFASGTSGKPKGVMITHPNISNAIKHQKGLTYNSSSRVLEIASYSFDVAWSNFVFALVGGACLCISSEEERRNDLEGCISRYQVTHLDLTPSTLRLLQEETVRSLESVNLGGEELLARDARQWASLTTLHNMYGPSECTLTTLALRIGAGTLEGSIGKGVGVCTWIIDSRDELCPIG